MKRTALLDVVRTAFAAAAVLIVSACSDEPVSPLGPGSPPPTTTMPSPLVRAVLWVDPGSRARQTATSWRATRPTDAAQMDKIASQPTPKWFGAWSTNIRTDVEAAMSTMLAAGAIPLFVAYNIPQRDCGGVSGGSATAAQSYRNWITNFVAGIGSRRAVVILEPDALAQIDCLSPGDQQLRIELLRFAVQAFAANGTIAVYVDAGHSGWNSAAVMAQRLTSAGVGFAQGFALNVANFQPTSESIAYGRQISSLIAGKHFVIDTGRNGLGPAPDGQWCNPPGRALGARPTTTTGDALVDGYLWVKAPGDSDGACNGGSTAQAWLPEYALGLAQRASY